MPQRLGATPLGTRTCSPCPFLPTPKSQQRLFSPSRCKAWAGYLFTFQSRSKTPSTRSAYITPSPICLFPHKPYLFVSWISHVKISLHKHWIMHIHRCTTRTANQFPDDEMDWNDTCSIIKITVPESSSFFWVFQPSPQVVHVSDYNYGILRGFPQKSPRSFAPTGVL